MAQFSMEIMRLTGSVLRGNQHTPFDGIAAKAAGIPFLAVCTGKYDRSAFQDRDACPAPLLCTSDLAVF